MSIVLKFSKPTFNVLTTGNSNLAFNSELATHAVYSVVDVHFPSGLTYTITHNLGYVPKAWVVWKGSTYLQYRLPVITGTNTGYDYYITSTTLVIQRDSAFGQSDFIAIIFTRSPNP